MPLISVVLPVYNGQKYLAEAIESIRKQTFKNFELLIIDDGSTDNSLTILKSYQRLDQRIRLIARENRNLATTLNDLIDLSQGEWIVRMDQDDISLPNRIERQLEWLEQTGADICGSWVKLFGTSHKYILKHSQTDQAIKAELLFGAPFAHPSVIMRTALAKKLRYDKIWEMAEDYDLWERAAHSGWQMTNVQEVLLLYRQHAKQITNHSSSQNHILSQMIRRRYWQYFTRSMCLQLDWIDEVLKIRESSPSNINMDYVDSAFFELLKHTDGEARSTILDYATPLYFRAASECPSVVTRWSNLNKKYGSDFAFETKLKLWLVRVFRIQPDSKTFYRLKKYYLHLCP